MKKELENLKELFAKLNNGNGDLYLEATIVKPIEKDLDKLERIEDLTQISYGERRLLEKEFNLWCKNNKTKNNKNNLIMWLLCIFVKDLIKNE